MHTATLKALEFDHVIAAVRSFTVTPLGASAVDKLFPLTDTQLGEAALAAPTHHYETHSVNRVKELIKENGIPVRI